MRTTTNNPMAVVIKSEIDIHTAIRAVQEFAEKYPAERLGMNQVRMLREAANTMHNRIVDAWYAQHPEVPVL